MTQVTQAGRKASKVHLFLAAIRVYPNITRAARAAGIRREAHYKRYGADPVYTAAFDAAWKMGVSSFEDRVMDRAMEGVPEPVVYQGSLCYTPVRDANGQVMVAGPEGEPVMEPLVLRKFSVERERLMLQGARPEKYARKELTGAGGGPIQSALTVTFVDAPADSDRR